MHLSSVRAKSPGIPLRFLYPSRFFWVTISRQRNSCLLSTTEAMQVNASDRGGEWPTKGAADGAAAWRNELSGAAGGPVAQARAIYGDGRIAAHPPRRDDHGPRQLPPAPPIV